MEAPSKPFRDPIVELCRVPVARKNIARLEQRGALPDRTPLIKCELFAEEKVPGCGRTLGAQAEIENVE